VFLILTMYRVRRIVVGMGLCACLSATPAGAQQPDKASPATTSASTANASRPAAQAAPAGMSYWGESWTKLTLDGSNLKAQQPVLGQKDQDPEFTRELIQVQWRVWDPIDLYVIRPRHAEKPPVVLYLYSFPSGPEVFRDGDFCRQAVQGGVAAVGFVSALTADRFHDRPMREWFVSELQEALVSSVHDVQMILNYLASRGDFDMDRVGIFGMGSGATIAILAAAADPRIKVLDLLNPWGDWSDWTAQSALIPEDERPAYSNPEFQKRVALLDPVEWLGKLG